MATHKSAEKRARQTVRRQTVNDKIQSSVRTAERKIRKAILGKDKKAAEQLLNSFMKTVDKAAQKGVIHAKNAARRISRVAKHISALK